MALATTCPHCKTSFKVVADQLKLRRGLVRCGKCQEVFSGVDYLRYIDDPTPRPTQPATPGPKVFAQPGSQNPAHGEPAQAPREASLDDLKTAFFLPETVFNASVMVDPVTIQAPVPVYIPSPTVAPSSRHSAAPSPAAPDLPEAGESAAPEEARGDTREFDSKSSPSAYTSMDTSVGAAGATTSPWPTSGPMRWHDDRISEARRQHGADQHPSNPGDVERDVTVPGPATEPARAMATGGAALSAAVNDPGTSESGPQTGGSGENTKDAEPAESQASTRVEMAALKLSRLPEGMDLAQTVQRPAKPVKPALLDEAPANGAHFATGLEEEDHLAADSKAAAQNDQAIDFAARPREPGAKLWPAVAAVLLILALLQGLVAMRNEIAVMFPDLRPALASAVEPLGLKLELPRRYDAVTIESFELQATEATAGDVQSYFAQALLRNHAGHAVQWPAIELSLTDPNGQLLARKVLLASDYLGTTELREQGFTAKSERTVRVRLGLNQITPNGYSAVLFYP